ncbi:hypothetical protein C8R43DRAFT_953678 [Mycena crocata]|nr:hypothetical protein C8R43DRAFT_953678 [Mycena crocata]
MPPKPQILHSGSWWKDYHENRRRQRQRREEGSAPAPTDLINFEPQQPVITFIPGRAVPVYSRVGSNGTLIPLPTTPLPGPAPPPIPYHPTTATHPRPASKVVARFKKKIALKKDGDAELLACLAGSRAKVEAEVAARNRKARRTEGSSRRK